MLLAVTLMNLDDHVIRYLIDVRNINHDPDGPILNFHMK